MANPLLSVDSRRKSLRCRDSLSGLLLIQLLNMARPVCFFSSDGWASLRNAVDNGGDKYRRIPGPDDSLERIWMDEVTRGSLSG